jgi:hypothetical protein
VKKGLKKGTGTAGIPERSGVCLLHTDWRIETMCLISPEDMGLKDFPQSAPPPVDMDKVNSGLLSRKKEKGNIYNHIFRLSLEEQDREAVKRRKNRGLEALIYYATKDITIEESSEFYIPSPYDRICTGPCYGDLNYWYTCFLHELGHWYGETSNELTADVIAFLFLRRYGALNRTFRLMMAFNAVHFPFEAAEIIRGYERLDTFALF